MSFDTAMQRRVTHKALILGLILLHTFVFHETPPQVSLTRHVCNTSESVIEGWTEVYWQDLDTASLQSPWLRFVRHHSDLSKF